jgi:hypothetical protein
MDEQPRSDRPSSQPIACLWRGRSLEIRAFRTTFRKGASSAATARAEYGDHTEAGTLSAPIGLLVVPTITPPPAESGSA